MKDLASRSIELTSAQMQFLEEMAAQHGLPDAGKVVRCLVNHAREHPEKLEEIFGEVRCLDC